MECVLIGNYGVSNVGDEALKQYFLARYPDIEWQVLSAHPVHDEIPRLPAGLRSFFTTPWWKTVRAMRHCDAVVFGGGSLFTDVESVFACVLWNLHAAVARWFGKPVVLAFQGIGPFKTKRGEEIARRVVERAAFVSVRDRESRERIASWNMNTSCIQTADPIFILSQFSDSHRAQKLITVIPRHNSDSVFFEEVEKARAEDATAEFCIVSMQPEDPSEQHVVERLRSMLGPSARVADATNMQMLLETLGGATRVITQRYHGAIAALAVGVPVTIVPQGEGDKLWALRAFLDGKDARAEALRLREDALRGEAALREWFGSRGKFSAAR